MTVCVLCIAMGRGDNRFAVKINECTEAIKSAAV